MSDRDVQTLLRCPHRGGVSVEGGREVRIGRVVVQATAHLQQLGNRDVVAVRHIWDMVGDRVAEPQPALLRQEHDQRGGHCLGVGRDPEVGIGGRRCLRTQLGGADGRGEITLRRPHVHHSTGHAHVLGLLLHHRPKAGRVDGPQRRTGGRRGRATGEHQRDGHHRADGMRDHQSGSVAASGTTTANRSAIAARLADCMAAAATSAPSAGNGRVAVAAATTVGA